MIDILSLRASKNRSGLIGLLGTSAGIAKVTPQKGKLILFPPFWTHEHRGVTLAQGVKYIATTWVVFA